MLASGAVPGEPGDRQVVCQPEGERGQGRPGQGVGGLAGRLRLCRLRRRRLLLLSSSLAVPVNSSRECGASRQPCPGGLRQRSRKIVLTRHR